MIAHLDLAILVECESKTINNLGVEIKKLGVHLNGFLVKNTSSDWHETGVVQRS